MTSFNAVDRDWRPVEIYWTKHKCLPHNYQFVWNWSHCDTKFSYHWKMIENLEFTLAALGKFRSVRVVS